MSKATTELEIEISDGRISMLSVLIPNGIYQLVLQNEDNIGNTKVANIVSNAKLPTYLEDVFILIEASKLRLEDDFMTYQPKENEIYVKDFKRLLTAIIQRGIVKDYYRPKFDPSWASYRYDEIYYMPGEPPAVGKSYNVWVEMARKFCPECNSRLMKKSEYIVFLGWLIKKLVENGWSKEKAWNAVCTDSKELGHYWNSENAKHDFETTKSREILGLLYDLGNTLKLLADDDEGANKFWVAGGYFNNCSNRSPLADLGYCSNFNYNYNYGVGLLAFSA